MVFTEWITFELVVQSNSATVMHWHNSYRICQLKNNWARWKRQTVHWQGRRWENNGGNVWFSEWFAKNSEKEIKEKTEARTKKIFCYNCHHCGPILVYKWLLADSIPPGRVMHAFTSHTREHGLPIAQFINKRKAAFSSLTLERAFSFSLERDFVIPLLLNLLLAFVRSVIFITKVHHAQYNRRSNCVNCDRCRFERERAFIAEPIIFCAFRGTTWIPWSLYQSHCSQLCAPMQSGERKCEEEEKITKKTCKNYNNK